MEMFQQDMVNISAVKNDKKSLTQLKRPSHSKAKSDNHSINLDKANLEEFLVDQTEKNIFWDHYNDRAKKKATSKRFDELFESHNQHTSHIVHNRSKGQSSNYDSKNMHILTEHNPDSYSNNRANYKA